MPEDSETSDTSVLLQETTDGVLHLTLNRPSKKNALSNDLVEALGPGSRWPSVPT